MFTTICPKCGREVDIAETDCPHCSAVLASEETPAAKTKTRAKAPPPQAGAAPAPPATARAEAALPALPSEPARKPRRRRVVKVQTWAIPPLYLAILAGFLVGTIGIAVYYTNPGMFGGAGKLKLEDVPDEVEEGYGIASASLGEVEVSGVRTWWDAETEKIKVRAVVVNHGEVPKSNVDLKVHLRSLQSRRSSTPIASFDVQVDGELGARESRDVEADLMSLAHPSALPKWNEVRIELVEQ